MAIYYRTSLDRTFHALGDETRRRMLGILAVEGAKSASQLGKPFRAAQPTASKHLKVLERAGLVSREVDGRSHIFRLKLGPLTEAEGWISKHRTFWEGTLDRLSIYLYDPEGDQ